MAKKVWPDANNPRTWSGTMREDDLVTRLRAAAAHDGLGIGEAWALLDEAAEALAALTLEVQTWRDGGCVHAADDGALLLRRDRLAQLEQAERERDEARALLRDCRTALLIEAGEYETCVDRVLLARIDAVLGRGGQP